jgi:hypothetical protein
MGLSRLDNFLKSSRGTILYVNPNDLDATDSIENQGNSLTRPFRTIQRALIESARFSYQRGLNNDRFGKTTILLYPGDHEVDNRPGFIPDGPNTYRLRSGAITNDLPPYDLNSNLSLDSINNELFKLNSIHGGVIVPRGTSIVGLDLRKTKVRPKYIPDPENDNIERTALFRITGGCYFWQFTMFDSNPNGLCFKDYTLNQFVPNFSHHKISCFEYADGVNNVSINDDFQTFSANRTDLDMYYEKISLVYGQSSGRAISPDYPSSGLDIQAKIDEYRIVGSTGVTVGITSIKSGDGVTTSTDITVTTQTSVDGLDVDTPFRIAGITATGYNGQYVVSDKVSGTIFKFQVQNAPVNPLPTITGAQVALQSDTVTSASPYIFNISLRSVFGMCGLHADGSKATGFKSMVVAQFTGIGLQKDDNAFVKYNSVTGLYEDNSVAGNETLSNNSRAVHKPSYKNFHIKCSNKSVIQAVSIFAIGFAEHFVSESGGDQSITNSNSNFGAKALIADGFRNDAFAQDDVGYVSHIVPPREISLTESTLEFDAIDVLKTDSATGIGSTGNIYLFNQKNKDVPPENVIEGYRIGARENDSLNVLIASSSGVINQYSARIVMPNSQSSSEKLFTVNRSVSGINSIGLFSSGGTDNVITLTEDHTFLSGESIRIVSSTGQLPDGILGNTVYFAIPIPGQAKNIKVGKTFQDAVNGTSLTINEKGGLLKVSSRVTDKNSGDIGHPIQYDDSNAQWYVKVSTAATDNNVYSTIVGLGSTGLGTATPRSFIQRRSDVRNSLDTLYRMRYVIPAGAGGKVARPPVEGFILQESNTSIGATDSEVQTYFGSGSITNVNQQRNFRFISNAEWTGTEVNVITELPHNLSTGSHVELVNIKSTNNTTGVANSAFNNTYTISGIGSARSFTVGLTTNPGTYTNDSSARTTSLPHFKRKEFKNSFYIYRNQEVQKYVQGEQDGIYYITLLNANSKPTVSPFRDEKYSQPVKSLFPQIQRDNPVSDPDESQCFAKSSLIGLVEINDVKNSLTKESVSKYLFDSDIGVGVTNIKSQSGVAHTITTKIEHGLNRITKLSITGGGTGYGSGTAGDYYNASLVGIGTSVTGKHATAKITVNGDGTITTIKIMDGGSAYGIGNTLYVAGVSTYAGFSSAVVTVDKIYNNVGDTLKLTGVNSEGFAGYNQLYRITDVAIGAATTIVVSSASSVGGFTTTGIGLTFTNEAHINLTGQSVGISSLIYTNVSGIATVTTIGLHGFAVDQKVKFTGADNNLYNNSFVVTQIVGQNSFSVDVGVTTTSPNGTGTIFALPEGLSSNGGVLTSDNENIAGRMVPIYAGITTSLSTIISNSITDEINITGISNLDINIGDYLMVDNEVLRVKTTTTGSNPVKVFRGVLGTKPVIHGINSVIRKIKANPVEFRRHSINRASGHTFEYVGFGPGNYSTALPDRHDRQISADEELLAQSLKRQGGINFYTGMNDKGISYSGNKKLSTITGSEEIFDTPFQTITGEDISNVPSLNIITPVEGLFSRSIRIEGGPDNKVSSEFNGPLVINNKLTINSNKGLEANSIFLQGDATVSRKYTVGIATPALAGNPGDLVYNTNPSEGSYVGWIYTTKNDWRRFGTVSLNKNLNIHLFDKVAVGTTTPGEATFKVGAGITQMTVDNDGVGIGTTANGYKLYVNGDTNITGNVIVGGTVSTAGSSFTVGAGITFHENGNAVFAGVVTAVAFHGDGEHLTNLSIPNSGWTVSNGILYNTTLGSVGIGTSISSVNLTVGEVGISSVTMVVNGNATFAGLVTTRDAIVVGVLTASGGSYDLDSSTGRVNAGFVTTGVLNVTGTTTLTGNVTAGGDITASSGHLKMKTFSEASSTITPAGGVITLNLDNANTFDCTLNQSVSQINLSNIPVASASEGITFSLRVTNGSTYTVDFDDFRYSSSGIGIPVYWPGGITPTMTSGSGKIDLYSFKTFYVGTELTLFAVVGGQNFGRNN